MKHPFRPGDSCLYKYALAHLFPLVSCFITPSEFIKEMELTTEERYKKLTSTAYTMKPHSQFKYHPYFLVTPVIIVFQSFEPRKTYSVQVQIRNCHKILMPLKMICPKSSYFTAHFLGPPISKLAPGLTANYEVIFMPKENKDYNHQMLFKTENDLFVVPIVAIGPRALLDVPDKITVQSAPVKIPRTKFVLVRNIGQVPAVFRFIMTGSPTCFKVNPAKGCLMMQEILQLSITFESALTGNYTETMHLILDSGEKLCIDLYGSAENINVRLDKNCIMYDNTYMGLKRSKSFRIYNNSQSLVKYSWKKYKTLKEDMEIIDRISDNYKTIKEIEMKKYTKQDYFKLCNYKKHELAWERILDDELHYLEKAEFNFSSACFKIEPQSGEIFPKSSAELIAVFEPKNCGSNNVEAYLEVSGMEDRLVLQMKGNGKGPLIVLNVDVLDIDFIFLCSLHSYEVLAINKGDIPGTISFKSESLVFGGKVEVTPESKYLNPEEHAAFIITFTSNRHGDFTEKLNFIINESEEIVSMIIKGKIVSPTLHFDKNLIDFGNIPVGFPVSKEVTLSNLSMVPVTFSLRVLYDGTQPSISIEKYSKFTVKPSLPKYPKEFQIEPSEGVVEPFSSRTVTLTVTANIARRWTTNLMVDMWDSETESVSCPVRFISQIASISIEPSLISISFCFLNFPYSRSVTLLNNSRIAAFFYIVPQKSDESQIVTFSANIWQGVIEPKSVVKISLTILTTMLGRQTLPLNVIIFGNEEPYDICSIVCVGQGPVITLKPNNLNWDEVTLLEESTKFLTVTNESPIPASLKAAMLKSDSPWTVTPQQSVLAPEEKISLNVTLLLRDRGKYQDSLKIHIQNSKTLTCATSAVGIGNSLIMDPDISGSYDLRILFCRKKYRFDIKIKNEGTKQLSIIWSPTEDLKAFAATKLTYPPDQIFKIHPPKLDLLGGQSKVLSLEVVSANIGIMKKTFYCHASIDSSSKEIYLTSEISAQFVEPLVVFDKTELHFQYNFGPGGIEGNLSATVNVINKSVLPIAVNILLNHPFYLRGKDDEPKMNDEIDLCGFESRELTIIFQAEEHAGRYCRIVKDKLLVTFKDHSKKSSVRLIGEVNYPNVVILPRTIDFGCIPVGTSAYREFVLVNVNPITVHYNFFWNPKSSIITYIDEPTPSGSDLRELLSRDSINGDGDFKVSSVNEEEETLENETGDSEEKELTLQSETALPKKPVLNMPDINVEQSDIKEIVFPLVRKYYGSDDSLANAYKRTCSTGVEKKAQRPDYAQMFDITPFYGRLEKYESQVIMISFHSNLAVKAHIEAHLRIEAGPTEIVTFDAKAANLSYALNKVEIDFGKQLFCGTESEYLKVSNTSMLPFEFETNTVDNIITDASKDFPIEAGVLIVTPRSGYVPPESEKVLRVRYHPGIPGKFENSFQLRIGYLDPVNVRVKGYAVFPQVYFSLSRTQMASLPVEIGYAAVAGLTPDWILNHSTCWNAPKAFSDAETERGTGNGEEDGKGSRERDETYQGLDESYVFINKYDFVPSTTDIDMATERIMARELLSNNAESVPKHNIFGRSIPNFSVPAYEVDLGIVIIGRSVEETFTAANYGPLPAMIYQPYEKDSKNRAINIKMKNRLELKAGGTSPIVVSLAPSRNKSWEQCERVEHTFYFEVQNGAQIPVKVSALVTYPFVEPSARTLDFGDVTCGNCKVICFKMKNFGWVPASWSSSFHLNPKEVPALHQSGFIDGRSAFHWTNAKGTLHPQESSILQVTFKPHFEGRFSATILIKLEEGFVDHRIALTGEGVEARLKISETYFTFQPSLPYPRTYFKCFTIQNPCAFPVEFFFPDFDEQIHEEERILRALTLYYRTNELFLPVRNPGDQLPEAVLRFYELLVESVSEQQAEAERQLAMQNINVDSISSLSFPAEMSSSDLGERKVPKAKKGRPRSSLGLASTTSLAQRKRDVDPVLKGRTRDEVEDLVLDYIRQMHAEKFPYDPVQEALDSVTPKKKRDDTNQVRGLVVILHAAPQTNFSLFANHCSRILNIVLLTIDHIILEEVALARCQAGIMLRDLIEESYVAKLEETEDFGIEQSPSAEEREEREMTLEEDMEELNRKIQSLFAERNVSQNGHKKTDTKSGNLDSVETAKKEKLQTPNVKNLQAFAPESAEELIFEILRFRLNADSANGVVMGNLNSIWITNRVNALKVVIKAAGNISDILVMCLVNTYDNYKNQITETEKENEQLEIFQREEALRILQEEEEEKFLALDMPDDEKLKIRKEFLNARHEEYRSYLNLSEHRFRVRENSKHERKGSSSSPPFTGSRANQNKDNEKLATMTSTKDGEKAENKDRKENTNANKQIAPKSSRKSEDSELLHFAAFEEEVTEMRKFLECWDRISGTAIKSSSEPSPDCGVPLWLINETNRNASVFPLVCQHLHSALQNRSSNSRALHDRIGWTADVPEAVTYSMIMSAPRRERRKIGDEYRLAVMEQNSSAGTSIDMPISVLSESTLSEELLHLQNLKKSDSQPNVKTKKKYGDTGRGKRAESRSSASTRNARSGKLISATAFEDFNAAIKSRWVLQPKETTFWCIQFYPAATGEYNQAFPIVVMPSKNSYTIKCKGICDIPRIDMKPENIFNLVAASKPKDNIYSPTFFLSTCCFDFGSVIPGQQKEFGRGRELHAVFSLTNISTLPVELTVMFAGDALRDEPVGSPHFEIQPTAAELKPCQTFLLSVYANPTKYGAVEETLLIFVKDNPKVEAIKIKCYGVKVNLVFEPKIINFDRLLLYRSDKRKITFTNSNLIPLFIFLSGYENLPPQFKFSAVKTWVQPMTAFVLEIQYDATEIQVIKEEVIRVLVFERPESVDPVQVLSFTVSAEAYDASVDIFFSSKDETHVDFGDIRVENEYVNAVTLKNTGKYMLGFKINIDYNLLEESGNGEFHIFPEEGTLGVGKLTTLNVHFLARSEINWKRLPLFKISLTEPYNNDEFIASIPIEVSARSFFSRYSIRPLPEMNIGPIQIGSQKTVPLTIENKGRFSISYSIEPFSADTSSEAREEASAKHSKNVPSKEAEALVKAGAFDISPGSGAVEAKDTSVINVAFCPAEVGRHEEMVTLRVSECPPQDKDGIQVKIVAEGCLPVLDFQDLGSIFREHHIKQSDRDLPYLSDVGFQTVFTVDSSELCFKNVCLGKMVKARIHLENRGQIDCHVNSAANRSEGRKTEAGAEAETDVFRVEPSEVIIPPYESRPFTIYFQPEILQNYKGLLSLTLTMPQKYSFITWTINLYGIVCIPQIEIVEPTLRSTYGQGILNFPPTTAGRTSNALISFRNMGKIDSKVIVELYNNEKGTFTLIPKPETEILLKAWDASRPIDLATVVSMAPGQTAEFTAAFRPSEVKKYACNLRLLTVDNGFENSGCELYGEAFLEEVVLERIKMDAPFAEESIASEKSCRQTVSGHYFANLGCCFVNRTKRILARLANKTEKDHFRFAWSEIPELVTVQPSAGHLYPETYKEILITFSARENVELNEKPLTCSLKKIHFAKAPPTPSWDTRLVHYPSLTDPTLPEAANGASPTQEGSQAREIRAYGPEPAHEAIPDSDSKILLHLSAVADYARPRCETTSIHFPDTFTFQTRECSVNLENVGKIPFRFLLELKSVNGEASPSRNGKFGSFPTERRNESEAKPFDGGISAAGSAGECRKPRPPGNRSVPDSWPEGPGPLAKAPPGSRGPFRLGRACGAVDPGAVVSCPITFSPLDVNEYKGILKITVENVHPEFALADIAINARSVMPRCHFDIAESDYITSGRRDYSRPGPIGYCPGVPLDPGVKPIEVKVLGVRVTKHIHFHALNPTENEYNFSWVNVTQNQTGSVQPLHCGILSGSIQPGRQQLMEFLFLSHSAGTFEYFWKFHVPEHQIETTFLFVIIVREPVIHFLRSNLIMRATSIGATVTETATMVNQEEVSSDFSIIPESLHSNGGLGSLKIQPLSGRVEPKSEIKFRISYTGKTIGKALFRLRCKIKKLQNPIGISVETTTYTVEPVVTYEDFSGSKHFADPTANNVINLTEELQTDQAESITFFLTSTSKLSFHYEWTYDKREALKQHCLLTFSRVCGHVAPFARSRCDLKVVFARKSALVDFPIQLKVSRGPAYAFLLNAKATCPAYKFSFSSHDFGCCYVQSTDASFYEANLVFCNHGKTELILESSTDELENFKLALESSRIGPGMELHIPIRFIPRESISYEEDIRFAIGGGLYEKLIHVSGRGIEFKVGLARVEDAKIHLGAVRVGNRRSEEFAIVNRGLAPATVVVGVGNQLAVDVLRLRYPEKEGSDRKMERLPTEVLTVAPSEPFVIKQNESRTLTVDYAPRERMSSFTETVYLQFQDRVEPLCVVTGSCVGPEFSLDKHNLAFGAVVANYSTALKLRLVNSGDIGARFKWETNSAGDEFSISPASGYLSAESDAVMQVTFHPRSVGYCNGKAECRLFISDTENYPSLFLSMCGDCVDLPDSIKTIAFQCETRKTDKKTLEIDNATGADWKLLPIFTGEYFSGVDLIYVPSMSSEKYEITYSPLAMSGSGTHSGSLFFCLPDGAGCLYDLSGVSLPPAASEVLEREVPCKTKYEELLIVRNWLRSHQRFKVTTVCTANENPEDSLFTCSGSDHLELPASAEKEYKLSFHSYKTGKLRFSVFFTNGDTGEYLWYDVTFNVVLCGPLEFVTLKTPVRQICSHEIKLENPSDKPIQYKIQCANPEVLLPRIDALPPRSTEAVSISFRPLHPGDKTEQLRVTCPELGVFPMELHLIALEPQMEETVYLEAYLGSADTRSVSVTNFSSSHALLHCRSDSEEFQPGEERLSVGGHETATVDVTFEPFALGQFFGSLRVESERAGDFVFPLVGKSLKPLARGPYVLKPETGIDIPFKNALKERKSFRVYVDNPAFAVDSGQEDIPPGGVRKIHVSMSKAKNGGGQGATTNGQDSTGYPAMGQLVVECLNPPVKWQYYLKCHVERPASRNT